MDKKITIHEKYEIPETSEGLVVPIDREKLISENDQLPRIIKNTQDLVELVAFNMESSVRDFFYTLLEKVKKYDPILGTIKKHELAFFRSFLVGAVYDINQKVKDAEAKWELQEDELIVEPVLDQEILDSLGKLGALGNILNIALQTRYKAQRAVATIDTSIKNTEGRIEEIEKIPEERRSPAQNEKLEQYGKTLDSNKSKKETRESKLDDLQAKIDEIVMSDGEIEEVWESAKELIDYLIQNYQHETADLDKDKLLELQDFSEALKLTLSVNVEQVLARPEVKERIRKRNGIKEALFVGLLCGLAALITVYVTNRTSISQYPVIRKNQQLQRKNRQLDTKFKELKAQYSHLNYTKENSRKWLASYCETLFRTKIARFHGILPQKWQNGDEPVIDKKFPELGKNVSLLVRIRKFEKKEYKKEKYLYTTKDGQEIELVKSFWKGKYTLEIKLSARPNDPLEKVVELDGYTYVPANGDKSLDEVIDFSRIRKVD